MRSPICLLCGFVVSASMFCHAQSIPVVAKRRIVQDVLDSSGKILQHSVALSTYLRNSSGSTLIQNYAMSDGRQVIKTAQLIDYDRHKVYWLNYETHEAIERADLPYGPHPEYYHNSAKAMGWETLNGVRCFIGPIYEESEGRKWLIGKYWSSPDDELTIKEDAVVEPHAGSRTHQVTELYDISLVEPDASEFAIEQKFSIVPKQSAADCKRPGSQPKVTESIK